MRLNLAFDVTIDGNSLNGTSKAGMLPASKVTGTRVAQDNEETPTVDSKL